MAELQKGLEGVIAAETKISSIIDSQLTYSGYDIDDLAENAQFEEIMFLLWNYRLPTQEELEELKEKLKQYMTLNPRVYKHFEEYATDDVHPMTALRTSVSYIAHFDPMLKRKQMKVEKSSYSYPSKDCIISYSVFTRARRKGTC